MVAHTKKILIITNDAFFHTRVTTAIGGLPVSIHACGLLDATRILSTQEIHGVVMDAKDQTAEMLQLSERLVTQGADFCLLAQVSLDDLEEIRLPERLRSDFFVEAAQPAEITARLRFLLWPKEMPSSDERIIDGPLVVNLATYQVSINGVMIDFAYLEYALFVFLVTHPNRTHTRDELLRRVWGGQYYGGSRTVDVHIRRVRAKLDPEFSQRLETVRGVGYLWHAE